MLGQVWGGAFRGGPFGCDVVADRRHSARTLMDTSDASPDSSSNSRNPISDVGR